MRKYMENKKVGCQILKTYMKQKKLLVTFALGMCALMAAHAQDNDFDLGSQRSEVQLVNPVPGKKIDHQGLVINPDTTLRETDRWGNSRHQWWC